ncbi:MAG TPA: toxin-antitoxin system YwqK family antitoxin, partial [Bacteroidia bacterium]|nr:toxin-antitoxin system YwqK family antitoxin [Bacteroidia bacterium]
MRQFIKFLFLTIPTVLFAQQPVQDVNLNGFNKFYYENGKISSEGTMRDGKPDGYWKTYSANGTIKSEGNRKDFKLDSTWKFYSEQGKLAFEFNYKEGKKNGLKKKYDTKDGSLVTSEEYVNDVKDGLTTTYYKDGNVKETIPFVAGKEDGQGFEYDQDGVILTLTQYKKGFIEKSEIINRKDKNGLKQGMWKEFYPNGVVKTEVTYTDDKMSGYLKEYSPKGSLVNTTKYVNGVLQKDAPELAKLDVKTAYYDDGSVRYTATYKDGVAEGIQREFSPEGKVINHDQTRSGDRKGNAGVGIHLRPSCAHQRSKLFALHSAQTALEGGLDARLGKIVCRQGRHADVSERGCGFLDPDLRLDLVARTRVRRSVGVCGHEQP